jgi:hypothetical protein
MPGFVSRNAERTIYSKSPPSIEVGVTIGAAGCSIDWPQRSRRIAATGVIPRHQAPVREGAAEICEQAGGVIAEQNGAKALIIDGDMEVAERTLAPRY